MAARRRSTGPLALGAAFLVAVLAGAGAAVGAPSDSGRPRWDESAPQRITGTVEAAEAERIVLDGLVAYDPPQGAIGRLVIELLEPGAPEVGDTVDVVVVRRGGRWVAAELEVLDPD